MGYSNSFSNEALAGVMLSHICHLLSVLILHELTLTVYYILCQPKRCQLALVAASLHIISPAGMFLSAPCAESCFSFLNFLGFYCYAKTLEGHSNIAEICKDMLILFSGIAFGVATTFRGNGLFSGLTLVYDAIACITVILRNRKIKSGIRRLCVTCVSGALMAGIACVPQYLAYDEYCRRWDTKENARPWCSGWIPSIYGWVQKEYW
jgi:phosphatidylinositol glycan class V